MYRSLVRNKDLKFIVIIQRDPAPRYEALFLSTEQPFLRLNQRAMGDESKKSLNDEKI